MTVGDWFAEVGPLFNVGGPCCCSLLPGVRRRHGAQVARTQAVRHGRRAASDERRRGTVLQLHSEIWGARVYGEEANMPHMRTHGDDRGGVLDRPDSTHERRAHVMIDGVPYCDESGWYAERPMNLVTLAELDCCRRHIDT
jgi:hypothetical protein